MCRQGQRLQASTHCNAGSTLLFWLIAVLHESRKNKLDGNMICTPREQEVMAEVADQDSSVVMVKEGYRGKNSS